MTDRSGGIRIGNDNRIKDSMKDNINDSIKDSQNTVDSQNADSNNKINETQANGKTTPNDANCKNEITLTTKSHQSYVCFIFYVIILCFVYFYFDIGVFFVFFLLFCNFLLCGRKHVTGECQWSKWTKYLIIASLIWWTKKSRVYWQNIHKD